MVNGVPAGRAPVLRRRRTKSAIDGGERLEPAETRVAPAEAAAEEKEAEAAQSAETQSESVLVEPSAPSEPSEPSQPLGSAAASVEAEAPVVVVDGEDPGPLVLDAAAEEEEGLDVFVHRGGDAWVITPLSGRLRLELRPVPADGVPPPGNRGVIWRLDDKVIAQDEEETEGEDLPSALRQDNESLARSVSRRIKKVSSGMRRLRSVTEKLEEKLARYQEDCLDLERKQRRLQRGREDLSKEQEDLAKLRRQLEDDQARLSQERMRFNEEARRVTENLVQSKRTPSGDFAALSPSVFFAAAQEEFMRAAPDLDPDDEAALAGMRSRPEAAFATACNDFLSSAVSNAGADALVHALLAFQCLVDAKAPVRIAQSLEQLAGLSRGVAKAANVDGRMRLSFAASSCTLWCGVQLADYLSQRWDEANIPELLEELAEETPDLGFVLKRTKFIQQTGSSMKRVLKSLADYADHRRRFIRCLGKPGAGEAAESDLRLLLLPREARPAELAAHVRRLSGVVEEFIMESRGKRTLQEEVEAETTKRQATEARLILTKY